MKDYKLQFILQAIASNALSFGEFTLKSGRTSPYFFNAGQFFNGESLATLGHCYAQAVVNAELSFDMLFGPAYKGIPLAAATAIGLQTHYNVNVPYCYNRKEQKTHGEGGSLVGAPLRGRVLIVDDVITAGTAVGEVMTLLDSSEATAAAVVVGLDRQERGTGTYSATQMVEQNYGIPVISIVTVDDILAYLLVQEDMKQWADPVRQYRNAYGVE